jgi:hypothetical protein
MEESSTESTMQVLRTTTATPIVEPTYGVARAAGGSATPAAPVSAATTAPPVAHSEARPSTPAPADDTSVESAKRRSAQPADMPALSGSDRAAIASATGFYISPTGEVTPDGMPPWSFIMQYLQRRHAPAEAPPPPPQTVSWAAAEDGPRVDLQV